MTVPMSVESGYTMGFTTPIPWLYPPELSSETGEGLSAAGITAVPAPHTVLHSSALSKLLALPKQPETERVQITVTSLPTIRDARRHIEEERQLF